MRYLLMEWMARFLEWRRPGGTEAWLVRRAQRAGARAKAAQVRLDWWIRYQRATYTTPPEGPLPLIARIERALLVMGEGGDVRSKATAIAGRIHRKIGALPWHERPRAHGSATYESVCR